MRKINWNKMVPGYGVELWSIAKSHKQGAGEFELFKNWGVREEEDVTLWGKMDDNTKQMDWKFEVWINEWAATVSHQRLQRLTWAEFELQLLFGPVGPFKMCYWKYGFSVCRLVSAGERNYEYLRKIERTANWGKTFTITLALSQT